jgi:hypothetical protein
MQSTTGHRRITTSQYISEAAGILATGILRSKRRQTGDTGLSEKRLDSSVNPSIHSSNKPSARGEKP